MAIGAALRWWYEPHVIGFDERPGGIDEFGKVWAPEPIPIYDKHPEVKVEAEYFVCCGVCGSVNVVPHEDVVLKYREQRARDCAGWPCTFSYSIDFLCRDCHSVFTQSGPMMHSPLYFPMSIPIVYSFQVDSRPEIIGWSMHCNVLDAKEHSQFLGPQTLVSCTGCWEPAKYDCGSDELLRDLPPDLVQAVKDAVHEREMRARYDPSRDQPSVGKKRETRLGCIGCVATGVVICVLLCVAIYLVPPVLQWIFGTP